MNQSNYWISLDINKIHSQLTLSLKQGETGRRIHISLTEDGRPYQIGEGCYAWLQAKKNNSINPMSHPCTIENNKVVYTVLPDTTSATGRIDCEIVLCSQEEQIIISASFSINIYNTVFSEIEDENKEEISTLTKLISDANTLITDVEDKLAKGDFNAGFAEEMNVTVKTGDAGSEASVLVTANSETPNTAKQFNFDFTIPKGEKGEKGDGGSVDLSEYATKAELDTKLNLSGGIMTGEITIGQGDNNGIQLGKEGVINATYSEHPNYTVFGMLNHVLNVGSNYIPTLFRSGKKLQCKIGQNANQYIATEDYVDKNKGTKLYKHTFYSAYSGVHLEPKFSVITNNPTPLQMKFFDSDEDGNYGRSAFIPLDENYFNGNRIIITAFFTTAGRIDDETEKELTNGFTVGMNEYYDNGEVKKDFGIVTIGNFSFEDLFWGDEVATVTEV